jgi:hypothetical protein
MMKTKGLQQGSTKCCCSGSELGTIQSLQSTSLLNIAFYHAPGIDVRKGIV